MDRWGSRPGPAAVLALILVPAAPEATRAELVIEPATRREASAIPVTDGPSAPDGPADEGGADETASPTARPTRWEEQVATNAELREATSAPLGASSTVVEPARLATVPSTLTDVIATVPGVSQNGQGGHLQVFSVRGISRHRVMSLISGMRVTSERRAGASVSFVDPYLMDSIEVQRGPSTTFHGSGALGGVVQVFPHAYRGWTLRTGFDSGGDENHQVFGYGTEDWSVGVARRDADDSRAADGSRLNDHFTQYSATMSRTWTRGMHRYEILFIPTRAEDVGKSNTDFPERATSYPLERHHLLKASVASEKGWRVEGWAHAHDLETEVVEQDVSRSTVSNDSLDFGARFEHRTAIGGQATARWGVHGTGRHGVNAEEVLVSLDPVGPPPQTFETLRDAREVELGAFSAIRWAMPRTSYELGGRLSWQNQGNGGADDEDLTALSGFVGILRHLGERVELRGSLNSGLRFPSLSERFFSGTTGAGQIVGNPDLEAERSLNAELSARWLGRSALIHAAVFRNEIDDYIERVELAGDTLTFRNLTSGTLQGLELQAMLLPAERWRVGVGGQVVRGRDDGGAPLADVPPHRSWLELGHRRGRWSFTGRLSFRAAKTDPGSQEKRIPQADELAATIDRRLSETWSLAVTGSNLLDEEYFPAADRKAPLAAERSVGVRLVRRPPPG